MVNWILWIVLGAVAGWLAGMITGRNDSLLVNILAGILGAIVGGWIVGLFKWGPADGFNLYSLLVSVIGAVVVLLIVNLLTGKRTT